MVSAVKMIQKPQNQIFYKRRSTQSKRKLNCTLLGIVQGSLHSLPHLIFQSPWEVDVVVSILRR